MRLIHQGYAQPRNPAINDLLCSSHCLQPACSQTRGAEDPIVRFQEGVVVRLAGTQKDDPNSVAIGPQVQ
jgi:hypothetical protein